MIDPLKKIEDELMAAARRRGANRHRRFSRGLAFATAVVGLVAVSAASAISGVGPVPSLDNEAPSPLKPEPQSERTQVDVKAPDGQPAVLRAFRGADRSLCVEAPPRPSPDASGICAGYDALARDFERRGLILNVGGPEDSHTHFVYGFVRSDATSVRIVDQTSRARDAELSEVWAAAKPGDGRAPDGIAPARQASGGPIQMRAFMLAEDGPYPTEGDGIKVQVNLANGRVLYSAFPSDYTP